ncbi:MAG: hypothetical protein P4L57_13440 [Rhizomicrobium sp.]|nr:hypothetical protein [Rhizomicrobium sp.]
MNIDDLLSEPLAPVADNGFSAQVMTQIRRQEQRQLILLGITAAFVATVACLLLPVTALTELLNGIVITLATSLEVGVAAVVILATWLFDRQFFHFWN